MKKFQPLNNRSLALAASVGEPTLSSKTTQSRSAFVGISTLLDALNA